MDNWFNKKNAVEVGATKNNQARKRFYELYKDMLL